MDPIVYTSFMILLLIFCVLGLIGNALNIFILGTKNIRTSTNYFLLGLTLSDTSLLIISFLRTMHNLVPYLNPNLEPLQIFVFIWDWICTSGTRYFTVFVSLERFIIICFPLKARAWITEERSRINAICVFIFTVVLAIFALFYDRYFRNDGFELFAALILHFIPFIVLAILNTFIYFGVQKFKKNRKTLKNSERKEISVTKMLLCVVLVFGICHSFEIARRIMNYVNYFDFNEYEYYDYVISYLADFFYVLNSSVNFIIYYLMVREFRIEFFKVVNWILMKFNKLWQLNLVEISNNEDRSTSANLAGLTTTRKCAANITIGKNGPTTTEVSVTSDLPTSSDSIQNTSLGCGQQQQNDTVINL